MNADLHGAIILGNLLPQLLSMPVIHSDFLETLSRDLLADRKILRKPDQTIFPNDWLVSTLIIKPQIHTCVRSPTFDPSSWDSLKRDCSVLSEVALKSFKGKAGLKKCNEEEVKLVNPNILRISCMSGIENGNIPEWLLVEVLVRLPVKSVFRLKLVSRKWLSLISDPYFVRVYVSHASSLSQKPWTIVPFLMRPKDSQFSHLDYELLKDLYVKPSLCIVGVPSIHGSQEEEKYLIRGVSNGLLFYQGLQYAYVDHNCYICNPLTGHCITLPPLAWVQRCGWGFHTQVEDGFLKRYRVVRVESPIKGSNWLIFQVFVSEIGEWKEFTVPCDIFPLNIKKEAVVLNGILHWIAAGHGIIAYDPYQNPESMRFIAPPDDIVGHDELSSLCAEYRGKLRYFEIGGWITSEVAFPGLKVWVLNDYSSGDWYLQHNISGVDVEYDANCLGVPIGPLCSHPSDSDIVYLGCDGHCASYNIKTRERQVEDEFFRHSENMSKKRPSWWMYSFLFVIPHWPISIPCPSHEAIES